MARLTRAQQQELTRAAVLTAARTEFADHGYADAKIDRIADRADLTRGAVYSNFSSKRALYLAVLLDMTTPSGPPADPEPGLAAAIGAFARVRLERLPLSAETAAGANLQLRSLTGVFAHEAGRAALAQLSRLESLLLARALEAHGPGGRRVRLAELVLTVLDGAARMAETAPGFGDPFDVALACRHLSTLELAETWNPPHLPYVDPARSVDEQWVAPGGLPDVLTGNTARLDEDGVILIVGTARLGAAEEAVRAARDGDRVTVVVVTGDPAELGALVRFRLTDLAGCLRQAVTTPGWPGFQVVIDDAGTVAAATGVEAGDETESAVRIMGGHIVSRADGRGAGHAAGLGAGNTSDGVRYGRGGRGTDADDNLGTKPSGSPRTEMDSARGTEPGGSQDPEPSSSRDTTPNGDRGAKPRGGQAASSGGDRGAKPRSGQAASSGGDRGATPNGGRGLETRGSRDGGS
ncbi:TetR/AcrR family transcriptional regulator [Actinoplanes sp. NPDC051494]|uniref:TetR/AcrR family transcriptional regulator n=1 Tax=Actinoplanes sp. NPDC051494 TaxID=3363907 RepID=UPI0037B215F1